MSYDAERIRNQAQDMIEKFYGYVLDVRIIEVKTLPDESVSVEGTFKEFGSDKLKSFTMRLDQRRRLLDFAIK